MNRQSCKPYPGSRRRTDAGQVLRDGIRRARITRLQRVVAHITLIFWPTKHAMQVVGQLPFDDEDDNFNRLVP